MLPESFTSGDLFVKFSGSLTLYKYCCLLSYSWVRKLYSLTLVGTEAIDALQTHETCKLVP